MAKPLAAALAPAAKFVATPLLASLRQRMRAIPAIPAASPPPRVPLLRTRQRPVPPPDPATAGPAAPDPDPAATPDPAAPDPATRRLVGSGLAGSPRTPDPVKPPSWPEVIATTVRLWRHRRARRGRLRRAEARRPGARRRAAIFGVVIIVFAAGGLTIALAQKTGTAPRPRPAPSTRPPTLSPAAVAEATASRLAAGTWVAAQISHSVVVACDPVMCASLQADGFPAGDLLPLSASANDPLGSAVVISTTALRNQFGSRLPDVYAPVVLATFGTGETRVDVRVEAPEGAQSYLVAQRADALARQVAGEQLVANKGLHVSGLALQEIAVGNLDSRLLSILAALTAQVHKVTIAAVGDSGPGAGPGVPLRVVDINGLVPPGHPNQDGYLKAVLAFLKAQQPPFLPSVTVLRQPGRTLIQIEYAAPSPLGLLGAPPPK